MKHLPNLITVVRAALIPLLAWLLLEREYGAALALFVLCALSDLADGWIARRFNLRSRFGAVADPLADKLTMLVAVLLLAQQGWLPWWFTALVIGRDLLIVAGAIAYVLLFRQIEMAPTWLSKCNTALEFVFLSGVLAVAAGHLGDGAWSAALLVVTSLTTLASGAQYVLVWSRKAIAARRAD